MTSIAQDDETPDYETRVLWEGEVLSATMHGDREHTAWAHYESTLSLYRRKDPVEGGVTVQLIQGDDVLAERFIDEVHE